MVTYPDQLEAEAKAFWQHTGFGISSRLAAFWLKNATPLREQRAGLSCNGKTEGLPIESAQGAAVSLRQRIAGLYNKGDASDVYLYPTGMSAIAHTAFALRSLTRHTSERYRVAVFG